MPTSHDRTEPRYPIRTAARRTGLTTATLRAWERRYQAVHPARSVGAQRLYSDEDIDRLRLIHLLVDSGYAAGEVATLPLPKLETLTSQAGPAPTGRGTGSPVAIPRVRIDDVATLHSACTNAIRRLDVDTLRTRLMDALVRCGPLVFMEHVLAPMLQHVGTQWKAGERTIAQEHAASIAVRHVLHWLLETLSATAHGQRVVAATLPGQAHEFGVMMAAAVAASRGCRVTYLGPDLPATDIATAVQHKHASMVLLSIIGTTPASGTAELRKLRRAVGSDVAIIAGGANASAVYNTLQATQALYMPTLSGLVAWFDNRHDNRHDPSSPA